MADSDAPYVIKKNVPASVRYAARARTASWSPETTMFSVGIALLMIGGFFVARLWDGAGAVMVVGGLLLMVAGPALSADKRLYRYQIKRAIRNGWVLPVPKWAAWRFCREAISAGHASIGHNYIIIDDDQVERLAETLSSQPKTYWAAERFVADLGDILARSR